MKARPLSRDEAVAPVSPTCQCAVEVVVTPTGPTEATQWVARVRVKEKGGALPWLDARTSAPHATSAEARGEVVLDFLAEVARDARADAEHEDIGEWARDEAAASAVLGRELTDADSALLFDALEAAVAALEKSDPDDQLRRRAARRAFVLALVPALAAEGRVAA